MLRSSKNFELLSVQGWKKVKFVNIKKLQKIGNIKIESFRVKHIAFGFAANGYAYRFTIGNKIIVFSGDSAKCLGVERACKNADVFICDASYSKRKGNPAHMDTYEIGEISSRSCVKKVILSHLYPQTDNIDLVREVKEKFSGNVVKGRDLMVISL